MLTMQTEPVHVETLPPFNNGRKCPTCSARYPIMVMFCRGCREATGGAHFHRICPREHRWMEQGCERPER